MATPRLGREVDQSRRAPEPVWAGGTQLWEHAEAGK